MVNVELDFSIDQERAMTAVDAWHFGRTKQFLTLGGYAGCGKSTLVAYWAEEWPGVAVAALCGKAAHVLRQKGVNNAQTIHSLLYTPYQDKFGRMRYRKRHSLGDVTSIIIDEASMIDHVLYHDLLSFRLQVLFVGDHGQLEPIGTNPNLMKCPDVKLERIHRQAEDNPILRLATAFREGRPVKMWRDPKARLEVVSSSEFDRRMKKGVQIICGFNKTRHVINADFRKMLHHEGLVVPGDTLLCLRNNKDFGIFNGQQFTCEDVGRRFKNVIELDVRLDDGRTLGGLPCLIEQFGADTIREFRDPKVALVDFGYAMTAHKAQGSEWDEVLALEEIASAWDPRRWRYTVATRAKERLVYCV